MNIIKIIISGKNKIEYENKKLFKVYGKIFNNIINKGVVLKEFEEISILGEKFYPLLSN